VKSQSLPTLIRMHRSAAPTPPQSSLICYGDPYIVNAAQKYGWGYRVRTWSCESLSASDSGADLLNL
jgi:hypothetical protein